MNKLLDFITELKADINHPEGRWGMHGHTAVEDDYFLALEYVVKRLEEITENTPDFTEVFGES